jgi:radical SAM protein with 4Fe4S-binding SPASM domain
MIDNKLTYKDTSRQNDILNKYPLINDIKVRWLPDDRKLVLNSKYYSYNKAEATLKNKYLEVTNDGYLLLQLADGTRSIKEIIDYICEIKNLEKKNVEFNIVEFYLHAKNKYEHIDLCDSITPVARTLQNTGEKNPYFPLHVTIELTSRCNLNCSHCYRLRDNIDFPYDDIIDIINKISSSGAFVMELTGGEITLHPEFLKIIEYAARKMAIIGVLSNGYDLSDDEIEKMSRFENKKNIFWAISLDSDDPDFHDSFRGKVGAHRKTCENIKKLRKVGFEVRVAMSVVESNFDHIKKTIDFAYNELNATIFQYAPVERVGKAITMQYSIPNRTIEEWKELNDFAEKNYPNFVFKINHNLLQESQNCGAGWRSIVIGPSGDLRPCVVMDEKQFTMDNIYQKSINDIFNKNRYLFFKNIQKPDTNICNEKCPDMGFCLGCFYKAMLINIERKQQGISPCSWAKRFLTEII